MHPQRHILAGIKANTVNFEDAEGVEAKEVAELIVRATQSVQLFRQNSTSTKPPLTHCQLQLY